MTFALKRTIEKLTEMGYLDCNHLLINTNRCDGQQYCIASLFVFFLTPSLWDSGLDSRSYVLMLVSVIIFSLLACLYFLVFEMEAVV